MHSVLRFGTGAMLIALLLAAAGCGSAPRTRLGAPGDWEVTVISGGDTTAVPVATGASPAARPPETPTPENPPAPAGSVEVRPESPAPVDRGLSLDDFVFGYRIQLLATSSMLLAESEAARADSVLTLPAYVEYEPPFYKVRVGDFYSREDADAAREAQVAEAFPQAWVVETMVRKPGPTAR